MCGISGGIFYKSSFDDRVDIVNKMSKSLTHRGPDDCGSWCDTESPVSFSHRRLSIIDTTSFGHQPMHSINDRWVITFNGEIYNYQDISKSLHSLGVNFEGHSDTRVLIESISTWGVEDTVKRLHGMFAFVAYDRLEKKIWLARDRMGEKPLYYGWSNGDFVFSSELKAIRTIPTFNSTIDRNALSIYLRHNYIPAPHSIYKGINKLLPGSLFSFDIDLPIETGKISSYWSLASVIDKRNSLTKEEGQNNFEKILRSSLKRQLHADVPVGVFLSGGVDSSLMAALMVEESSSSVKSFTIGFSDKKYNEAEYASRIASHLGTDHTELYVTDNDALEVVEDIHNIYDEPFADSSQIPTYLVMKMAKKSVTVALSGDGGDELFGGYERYKWANTIWSYMGKIPYPARNIMGLVGNMPILRRISGESTASKIQRVSKLIQFNDKEDLYRMLISHHLSPNSLLRSGNEPINYSGLFKDTPGLESYTRYMMYKDTISYLPDDILTKVDRASMAVSLEVRVPMLDHDVVSAAWSINDSISTNNKSKMPLRKILYKSVPKDLIERPKKGFAVPLSSWLRGPLREWAEELLSPSRLESEGYFKSEEVGKMWSEHLSGKGNWQYLLWNILIFQSWLENQ